MSSTSLGLPVRKPRFAVGDEVDFFDGGNKWKRGTVLRLYSPANKYSPFSYDLDGLLCKDVACDVKEHLMERWSVRDEVAASLLGEKHHVWPMAVRAESSNVDCSKGALGMATLAAQTLMEGVSSGARSAGIPSKGLVRHLQYLSPAASQFNIVEKVVEVPYLHEKDIVVEVPERHFHKVLNHVPRYHEKEVEKLVEVPEIHWQENIKVKADWRHEEIERKVPRTTVREVLNPVLRPTLREEEEIIEIPVSLPTIERIIEKPYVEVRHKLHYVKGDTEVETSEETIEVPHVVLVPRVVAVPKVEYRQHTREVVVPHIRQIERVVEVLDDRVIERDVDVPQIHTTRHIRYVPKFVHEHDQMQASKEEFDNFEENTLHNLKDARLYIAQLEQQKEELQIELDLRLAQVTSVTRALEAERRARVELEVELKTSRSLMGRELSVSPGSTVDGDLGTFSSEGRTVSPSSFEAPSPSIFRQHGGTRARSASASTRRPGIQRTPGSSDLWTSSIDGYSCRPGASV